MGKRSTLVDYRKELERVVEVIEKHTKIDRGGRPVAEWLEDVFHVMFGKLEVLRRTNAGLIVDLGMTEERKMLEARGETAESFERDIMQSGVALQARDRERQRIESMDELYDSIIAAGSRDQAVAVVSDICRLMSQVWLPHILMYPQPQPGVDIVTDGSAERYPVAAALWERLSANVAPRHGTQGDPAAGVSGPRHETPGAALAESVQSGQRPTPAEIAASIPGLRVGLVDPDPVAIDEWGHRVNRRPWLPELQRLSELAQSDPEGARAQFIEKAGPTKRPTEFPKWPLEKKAEWLDANVPLEPVS